MVTSFCNPFLSTLSPHRIKIISQFNLIAYRGFATHINSVSITQQFYNRLPIRKKYIRAIKRGTLIYDRGQVKIPPIKIEGYDLPKKCRPPNYQPSGKIYKGTLENLRAKRISFAD